jgi:hypothetical protein
MEAPKIGKLSIGEIKIKPVDLRSEKQKLEDFRANDLEAICKQEIGEQLQLIKNFEKKFKDRWDFEGDAGYFFSVCFKSQTERDNFLDRIKIKLYNDNYVFYEDIKHLFE